MGEKEIIDSQKIVISNLEQDIKIIEQKIKTISIESKIWENSYMICKNDFEFFLFITLIFINIVLFLIFTSFYFDKIVDFFTFVKNKIKIIWTKE